MPLSPVVQTLSELVRINSVNSAYADGPGEAEIAQWIHHFFATRGIEVSQQEVFPGRPNVLARIPGQNPGRRLVLEAHTDTVSVAGMTIPPFEPRIEEGKLFGRGACDTKAGLAAMMQTLADLHAEGVTPPSEVLLAAVVDEEYSYRGVVRLCEDLQADAAIVAEPTEMRLVIASKGVLRWRIVATGKAAHSSKPHLGVNAIHHMARLVLELEGLHAQLAEVTHPLLGAATGNIGVIQGGAQVNFVPDRCAIEIDRRLLPGEQPEAVLRQYQQRLDRLVRDDPSMRLHMEPPMLVDQPLETPPEARVVQAAAVALGELGLEATPCGVPFGSDASKLSRAGIPSIVVGPGSIDRAHAAVEYVELDQVEQMYQFLRRWIAGAGTANEH